MQIYKIELNKTKGNDIPVYTNSFQRNDIFIEKRKPYCSAYSYWTQRVGLYLSYSGGSGLNTHPNRVGHESFFTLAL